MKTAKTPAAANGKAASPASSTPADRAFLADNQRFLSLLRGAAESAGVSLDEFLIRAAFEAERAHPEAEFPIAPAPFVRAIVRHHVARQDRVTNGILGEATCDMLRPHEDGTPLRPLPRTFACSPESVAKEDARWLDYDGFCTVYALPCWVDDVAGGTHCQHLREDAPGVFTMRLEGTKDDTRHPIEWAPLSVACWFFGLAPSFVERQIREGHLAASKSDERLLNLAAVAALLGWLAQPQGKEQPPRVPVHVGVRGLYDIAADVFRKLPRRSINGALAA